VCQPATTTNHQPRNMSTTKRRTVTVRNAVSGETKRVTIPASINPHSIAAMQAASRNAARGCGGYWQLVDAQVGL